jgi:hypothetical protein
MGKAEAARMLLKQRQSNRFGGWLMMGAGEEFTLFPGLFVYATTAPTMRMSASLAIRIQRSG